jgi:hypothetical protein
MNEWLIITIYALSSILFAAGGTHISVIGGQKWLRRLLLPVLLASGAYCSHEHVLAIAGYALMMIVALSMGYGTGKRLGMRVMVFIGLFLPSMVFGVTIWQALSPVLVTILFYLSNNKLWSESVPHKLWEFVTGLLIGITFVASITSTIAY